MLSGRAQEVTDFQAHLQRLERGRSAQCTLVVGLRGVDKTVLLNTFAREAIKRDWVVVDHELTSQADFVATLARLVRQGLLELAPPSAWQRGSKKVGALLRGLEMTYGIAGLSITVSGSDPEPQAASGDAARDLTELLTVPQFDDYLRRHFELEPHQPRRRSGGR